jgi:hypothetical protein
MDRVLVFDSVTQLDASARGRVVACGSHGGLYAAWLAANAGVRGVILNDAGIGRHSAGIAGVVWLGSLGIPACTVDYRSARIGDGKDTLASGVVTMANDTAADSRLPSRPQQRASGPLHAGGRARDRRARAESRGRKPQPRSE